MILIKQKPVLLGDVLSRNKFISGVVVLLIQLILQIKGQNALQKVPSRYILITCTSCSYLSTSSDLIRSKSLVFIYWVGLK
jgi:hypothetical protein